MSRRAAPHRGADIHYGGDDSGRPSKTALKKQSTDLQVLGRQLAELPPARLAALDMPEALRDALMEYKRTRSHEGRRRQMQYVGKLMRDADEAPLREAVAEAKLVPAREALALHQAEAWREALVAGDEAMTRWQREHPDTDSQQLRSLVRAARRDALAQPPTPPGQAARQPRSWRELYRFVRASLAAGDAQPDGETDIDPADEGDHDDADEPIPPTFRP